MFKPQILNVQNICGINYTMHIGLFHLNFKVQVCIWAPIFLCILIMEIMWWVGVLENEKMITLWCVIIFHMIFNLFKQVCKCHYAHTCVVIFCGMCDKVKWVITSDHMVKCGLNYMIIWFAEGLNDCRSVPLRVYRRLECAKECHTWFSLCVWTKQT